MEKLVKNFNRIAVKRNFYFYFLVLFAALILIFSVLPVMGDGVNSGFGAHVLGYAVFSFSAVLFLRSGKVARPCFRAALLAGGYGFFIEMIQRLIPYRMFELSDILVNFTAAVAGTLPGFLLIRNRWI